MWALFRRVFRSHRFKVSGLDIDQCHFVFDICLILIMAILSLFVCLILISVILSLFVCLILIMISIILISIMVTLSLNIIRREHQWEVWSFFVTTLSMMWYVWGYSTVMGKMVIWMITTMTIRREDDIYIVMQCLSVTKNHHFPLPSWALEARSEMPARLCQP